MDRLAPLGPVYQAGTLSGNPLATAAGLATLRACTPEVYARWTRSAAAVAKLAGDALGAAGVPFRLQEAGNLFSVFLGGTEPVRDFDDARDQSARRLRGVLPRHAGRRASTCRHRLRGLVRVRRARRRGALPGRRAVPAAARAAAGALGVWHLAREPLHGAAEVPRERSSGPGDAREAPSSVPGLRVPVPLRFVPGGTVPGHVMVVRTDEGRCLINPKSPGGDVPEGRWL